MSKVYVLLLLVSISFITACKAKTAKSESKVSESSCETRAWFGVDRLCVPPIEGFDILKSSYKPTYYHRLPAHDFMAKYIPANNGQSDKGEIWFYYPEESPNFNFDVSLLEQMALMIDRNNLDWTWEEAKTAMQKDPAKAYFLETSLTIEKYELVSTVRSTIAIQDFKNGNQVNRMLYSQNLMLWQGKLLKFNVYVPYKDEASFELVKELASKFTELFYASN